MVMSKATSALAASAPKLSSRLGGFHLIILAAFTLLGFYVCFNQIKGLKIDVLTLKALLQEPRERAGSGSAPPTKDAEPGEEQQAAGGDPEPLDDFEEISAEEIQDAGLRDMLSDLVNAAARGSLAPDANGVTIIVGGDSDGTDMHHDIDIEVEEIFEEVPQPENTGEAPANADNLAALSVKDLRAMAQEKGLAVRAGAKKADIVALIRDNETDE
mgnify:CR=1 FL=1